ncbi:Os01g0363000, partial [Oryza sativa Japonica Group]
LSLREQHPPPPRLTTSALPLVRHAVDRCRGRRRPLPCRYPPSLACILCPCSPSSPGQAPPSLLTRILRRPLPRRYPPPRVNRRPTSATSGAEAAAQR